MTQISYVGRIFVNVICELVTLILASAKMFVFEFRECVPFTKLENLMVLRTFRNVLNLFLVHVCVHVYLRGIEGK